MQGQEHNQAGLAGMYKLFPCIINMPYDTTRHDMTRISIMQVGKARESKKTKGWVGGLSIPHNSLHFMHNEKKSHISYMLLVNIVFVYIPILAQGKEICI